MSALAISNIEVKSAYKKARLSRDARFDGIFFVGVKTTGIYCRPICPAVAPKEENIDYFDSALAAASAGLRPCLRCRPESAPNSSAWKGTSTTFERAIYLIDQAVEKNEPLDLEHLSERLGISSRYLRKLFNQQFGTSPKQYMQYKQLLFAKQLLQQTSLPVTQVALASGFASLRNFNQVFHQRLLLTPTQFRKNSSLSNESSSQLVIYMSYRPPYDWEHVRDFLALRLVENMEWLPDEMSFAKSFCFDKMVGYFIAQCQPDSSRFKVSVYLSEESELNSLLTLLNNIRRMFDLDADMQQIEKGIAPLVKLGVSPKAGLRLVGTGNVFEALCRAILGQQVSVKQAVKLLNVLVHHYGKKATINGRDVLLFPEPTALLNSEFDEFKMPRARKLALKNIAEYFSTVAEPSLDDCLNIKGIGPWTANYAKMRGQGDPNIFLGGDLVIKNRLLALLSETEPASEITKKELNLIMDKCAQDVAPWGSYMTFQLWSLA
ncbi:MAG: Ada metal-binding domain-containing protein [Parashewanella sp.]